MNPILGDELHLHLYGCLTPEDIFTLGKDCYKSRTHALTWYASEYEKYVGRRPQWQNYWDSNQGLGLITADFLANKPMYFPEFQARFNLLIALLPTTENAINVLNRIVPRQVEQNISYSEFRIFVPPALDSLQLKDYFQSLAEGCANSNVIYKGEHISRVILSVSRNPTVFKQQYKVLRDLQSASDIVAYNITGLDFCGVEEGHPPELLQQVFQQILSDNKYKPEHALAILYHVGETFDNMSIFSAMRWIHLSSHMGAHRLGHALAAGIPIENHDRFVDGNRFYEPISEVQTLLDFLRNDVASNSGLCEACDYLDHVYSEAMLNSHFKDKLEFIWNSDLRQAAKDIQAWLLSTLSQRQVIVETCPTSNRIIGRIVRQADLPVFLFAEKNVPITISTDDPGIFATTLRGEELICRHMDQISERQILEFADNSKKYRAGLIAGRSSY